MNTQPLSMTTRRLAYEPRANLFALIAFIAFSFSTLRAVDILVLTLVLGYVALSAHLPRPSEMREAASRFL